MVPGLHSASAVHRQFVPDRSVMGVQQVEPARVAEFACDPDKLIFCFMSGNQLQIHR